MLPFLGASTESDHESDDEVPDSVSGDVSSTVSELTADEESDRNKDRTSQANGTWIMAEIRLPPRVFPESAYIGSITQLLPTPEHVVLREFSVS